MPAFCMRKETERKQISLPLSLRVTMDGPRTKGENGEDRKFPPHVPRDWAVDVAQLGVFAQHAEFDPQLCISQIQKHMIVIPALTSEGEIEKSEVQGHPKLSLRPATWDIPILSKKV